MQKNATFEVKVNIKHAKITAVENNNKF